MWLTAQQLIQMLLPVQSSVGVWAAANKLTNTGSAELLEEAFFFFLNKCLKLIVTLYIANDYKLLGHKVPSLGCPVESLSITALS